MRVPAVDGDLSCADYVADCAGVPASRARPLASAMTQSVARMSCAAIEMATAASARIIARERARCLGRWR